MEPTAQQSDGEEPPGLHPRQSHQDDSARPFSSRTILSVDAALRPHPPSDADLDIVQAHRQRRRFPISAKAGSFRRRFFALCTDAEWNDWRWQMRNRFRTPDSLRRVLDLTTEEAGAFAAYSGGLPLAITPYFAALIAGPEGSAALRRTMVPAIDELLHSPEEAFDPLAEEHDSPVPGLVHRYPDRALFLVTTVCAANCRYCTRSRIIEKSVQPGTVARSGRAGWQAAIDYIAATPAIRDVLLSGGDPLTMSDTRIQWLLERLRRIPHVQIIRIGTKTPVVMPQRITAELVRMLKRYHPLYMSIHFTHPDELTPETARACTRLADAGIPLGSQTVLLGGVNDDAEVLKRLFHGLLSIRVRPYYLYQCDPIVGSAHFRTSVGKGLEIMRALRGHTTGYAVPTYVIDAPGGGGKIPILPDYVAGKENGDLLLRSYDGGIYRYPDRSE